MPFWPSGVWLALPTKAVLRCMSCAYYALRLERRYNVRCPLAMAMKNQTLPLVLSSLWEGSGTLSIVHKPSNSERQVIVSNTQDFFQENANHV